MGFYHTCALLSGGTVDCWGSNEYGQLGINDAVTERKVASSAPTEVKLQEGGFSARRRHFDASVFSFPCWLAFDD